MPYFQKSKGFQLKSGNKISYKNMGSSPGGPPKTGSPAKREESETHAHEDHHIPARAEKLEQIELAPLNPATGRHELVPEKTSPKKTGSPAKQINPNLINNPATTSAAMTSAAMPTQPGVASSGLMKTDSAAKLFGEAKEYRARDVNIQRLKRKQLGAGEDFLTALEEEKYGKAGRKLAKSKRKEAKIKRILERVGKTPKDKMAQQRKIDVKDVSKTKTTKDYNKAYKNRSDRYKNMSLEAYIKEAKRQMKIYKETGKWDVKKSYPNTLGEINANVYDPENPTKIFPGQNLMVK